MEDHKDYVATERQEQPVTSIPAVFSTFPRLKRKLMKVEGVPQWLNGFQVGVG